MMVRVCQKPLKQNPFEAYRDPATGRWFVKVKSVYFTNVLKPVKVKAALEAANAQSQNGTLQEA